MRKIDSTLAMLITCAVMALVSMAGIAAIRAWGDAQCQPRQVEYIARVKLTVWPCEPMDEPELTRYPAVADCLFGKVAVYECE